MRTSVKNVMPYGSLYMRLPDSWQEDAGSPNDGIIYDDLEEITGPFRIRREDFVLEPEEDHAELAFGDLRMIGNSTQSGKDAGAAFLRSFAQIHTNLQGPDIEDCTLEPASDGEQIFTYVKRFIEPNNVLLLQGWVRGVVTGPDSFTVLSFTYMVPEAVVFDSDVQDTLIFLDQEVRKTEVLSVKQAQENLRANLLKETELPAFQQAETVATVMFNNESSAA